jgi:hypothetical protein
MSERDDYAEPDAKRRIPSPSALAIAGLALTIVSILVAIIGVAIFLIIYWPPYPEN